MAQSRLEKIGTIFTRVSGLLRSGAMKVDDQPLWYEVYARFPPKLIPSYNRPAQDDIKIIQIFYSDDIDRAKFHKEKQPEIVNLLDSKWQTNAKKIVEKKENDQKVIRSFYL